MDIDKSAAKSNTTAAPRLRKNKKLEARWGQNYYAMVSEAVFMQRGTPFMPTDPPTSIRQQTDDVQPLHACKQCGDCFHFLSSLEAHNSRRSWILGYWCQNCFRTGCSHMQSGQPPCFDCQTMNRQRKSYLKAKGLRKGRKMGCIKIFYNQCQFYSHLNDHRINIVDMADIMLMPVPLEVEKERYAELERICETLLEHMFLTRTHIMDWLKSKKLGDKWWSVLKLGNENEENSLAKMLKLTGVPRGVKKLEKQFVKPPKPTPADGKSTSTASPSGSSSVPQAKSSNFSSSISETIEAVIAQSACSNAEPLTKTKDSETKNHETEDSETKTSETKTSETKNAETMDSGTKNSETKNSETNDSGTKTSETQNSETKDSGTKNSDIKNSETKDSGTKISETKNSETKDSGTQNSEIKNSETKASGTKNSETKNTENEDSGTKNSETKNTENEDSGTKNSETKNTENKDSGTNNSETKNSGTKNSETKNSGNKDSETKNTGTKNSEIKDSGTKITETKNSEIKDSGTKITETKNSETKDSGTKTSETKDSETRDSETRPSSSEMIRDRPQPSEPRKNLCITADIGFVDCGPVAKTYLTQIALPQKHRPSIISNGSARRASAANLAAAKTESLVLPQVPGNPVKIKETSTNIASAKPPSTMSIVNQGASLEPMITVKKFAYEHLKNEQPVVAGNNHQKNTLKWNNKKSKGTGKCTFMPCSRVTRPKPLLPAPQIDPRKPVGKVPIRRVPPKNSLSNLGSRILTVHSPKNADLSQIIGHFPTNVINGSKLVFIGQDPEQLRLISKSDTLSNLGMIKIQSESEKPKLIQIPSTEVAPVLASHNTTSEQSSKHFENPEKTNVPNDQTRPKIQQLFLDGKIIYQNGKKFVIRQTRKPSPGAGVESEPEFTPNNLDNLKLQTIPKRVTLSSFLSKAPDPITSYVPIAAKPFETAVNKIPTLSLIPIVPWNPPPFSSSSTPSSSPSSLSPPLTSVDTSKVIKQKHRVKENGKDIKKVDKPPRVINPPEPRILESTSLAALLLRNVHKFDAVEYYSVDQSVAGWLYIDLTKGKPNPTEVNGGLGWSEVCVKYKQQVVENMKYHGKKKSKELIDHLKKVHSEYSRIVGPTDGAKVSENLEAIKELEKIQNEISFNSKQGPVPSDHDIIEILFGSQETTDAIICTVCYKPEKSKSLITEFSKRPSKNAHCRNGYCSCNEYICHICHVFQGSMSRLISHLNFHAKREPFDCPECLKKFTSHLHLEIHVWSACFHLLARRWFKCKICNVEGFPDVESLTKHYLLAHSKIKIACPICGILLKSRTAFDTHCEGSHPSLQNPVPVILAECEVGKYLVRLEQYKAHLDEHVGVIKKLYYECPLCSFVAEESSRGNKSIKAHLHNLHSRRLWELVSPESLPAVKLSKHSFRPKSPLPSEKTNSLQVQTSQAKNTKGKSQDNVSRVVSDRIPNFSVLKKKYTDPLVSESIANDFQTDNPISDNPTLRDGVECNVGSMNVDQSKSAQERESKSKSSTEIVTHVEKAIGNRKNVIAEYSLSPQIYDVRSVTPDSYAELESSTKDPIGEKSRSGQEGALQLVSTIPKAQISETFGGVKQSDRSNTQTNVTRSESNDSVFVKLGEKLLPMKLPQVIVINQGASNINLTDVYQSTTITGPNTLIKLQDSNYSEKPGINSVEISTESSNKNSDKSKTNEQSVPVIKTVFTLAQPDASSECKNSGDIDTSESVVEKVQKSLDVKRPIELASLPVLKNNSSLKTLINDLKQSILMPNNSEIKTPNESLRRNANASASGKKNMLDSVPPRDISAPPPLARIPRLIEASRLKVPLEKNYESVNVRLSESNTPVKSKRRPKRPWRIALNAPLGGTECHTNYRCHLCNELINTSWPVTQKHFIKKHSDDYKLSILTPRLSRLSSEFVDGGYKEAFGSKKRKFDGNVPVSKRRRRWSPKKHVEKYPLDLGLCVEQESVQDGEGKFMCKKCDKRCDDILSLRTHIGNNHRIKDHYLVCLECGENFVVEPSLQMHLKVFHNIKDPSNYLKQNTAYAKEFTEVGESEPNTGIANQCHVCMAVFEDKSAVDKHLRVHGMAFLNRKRIEARIAARNPEKKIKVDKPNDSSTLPNSKTENTKNLDIDEMKPGGAQTVNERLYQEKPAK